VTYGDFDQWGDYLFDGPGAMALLDYSVEGASSHKAKGKSYRAHGHKQGERSAWDDQGCFPHNCAGRGETTAQPQRWPLSQR
jgi:hypothetical protein